mmetsp:Transcript_4869/g.22010  ORF Transcript_4869/g.22010 Transcript_4869/m.22010 type:complete len:211 (+) Transcript_4869:930-1562(+)
MRQLPGALRVVVLGGQVAGPRAAVTVRRRRCTRGEQAARHRGGREGAAGERAPIRHAIRQRRLLHLSRVRGSPHLRVQILRGGLHDRGRQTRGAVPRGEGRVRRHRRAGEPQKGGVDGLRDAGWRGVGFGENRGAQVPAVGGRVRRVDGGDDRGEPARGSAHVPSGDRRRRGERRGSSAWVHQSGVRLVRFSRRRGRRSEDHLRRGRGVT